MVKAFPFVITVGLIARALPAASSVFSSSVSSSLDAVSESHELKTRESLAEYNNGAR